MIVLQRADGRMVIIRATMKTSHQIESEFKLALRPGRRVGGRGVDRLIDRLKEIAEDIEAVALGGEPAVAASLYEAFIAACEEKADQVRDPEGEFGEFAGTLLCRWVRARDLSGVGADEIVFGLVSKLDHDPHGFCYRLEEALPCFMSLPVLDRFERLARDRIDASAPDDGGPAGYPRRRWTALLKQVLRHLGDAPAYVELCESSGGLDPGDCDLVAEMVERLGHLEEALYWVERGLALAERRRVESFVKHSLRLHGRNLKRQLGETGGAGGVPTWGLQPVGGEPPDRGSTIMATLLIEEALRILDRGYSRGYDKALLYLAMARDYMTAGGRLVEWEKVVGTIRQEHGGKRTFIHRFERIVEGEGRPRRDLREGDGPR